MFPHQVFSYTPVVDPSKIDESKNPVWNPGWDNREQCTIRRRVGDGRERNIRICIFFEISDLYVSIEWLVLIYMWLWMYINIYKLLNW